MECCYRQSIHPNPVVSYRSLYYHPFTPCTIMQYPS